jgi:hypothetical protein
MQREKNVTTSQNQKKKKTTTRRRVSATAQRPRARKGAPASRAVRPAVPPVEPEEAPPPAPTVEVVPEPVDVSVPEPVFAARIPEPEPERPFPSTRRAIFFDVENTSRAEHISRMIEHLAVDRLGRRTDFIAVGNWRVIGHDTARLLARHGAQLVHSAPSVGVRDWSDLRIAVGAGVWLASARPGDIMEVVSDDRAFDAIGDVASSLGIAFRRLSYRGLAGMPVAEPPAREMTREPAAGDRSAHRRRRGRGRPWREAAPRHEGPPRHAPPVLAAVPRPVPPAAAGNGAPSDQEPHTAPHDAIVNVVRDLIDAGRAVTLDTLANALKARGFSRPPGSPRLITRLRRIKELEVSRSGMITLVGAGGPPAERHAAERHAGERHAAEPHPAGRRPVERHPAERHPAERQVPAAAPIEIEEATDEGPEPGNEAMPPDVAESGEGAEGGKARPGGRRRRSRRGGRGRRRRSPAAPAS